MKVKIKKPFPCRAATEKVILHICLQQKDVEAQIAGASTSFLFLRVFSGPPCQEQVF